MKLRVCIAYGISGAIFQVVPELVRRLEAGAKAGNELIQGAVAAFGSPTCRRARSTLSATCPTAGSSPMRAMRRLSFYFSSILTLLQRGQNFWNSQSGYEMAPRWFSSRYASDSD